jgi:hypothetical protein
VENAKERPHNEKTEGEMGRKRLKLKGKMKSSHSKSK